MNHDEIKVGDQVSFVAGNKVLFDEVVYVDGPIVEGKKYDLSYLDLKKIEKN